MPQNGAIVEVLLRQCTIIPILSQIFKRTFDVLNAFGTYMGVYLGCSAAAMTQEGLNIP